MAALTIANSGKLFVAQHGSSILTVTASLFTAPSTPTVDLVYSDFTKPTYSGYADHDVAFDMTGWAINGSNDAQINGDLMTWAAPGSGSPQTLYGIFTHSDISGGPYLLGFYLFPTPISFGPGSPSLLYYLLNIIGQATGY